MLSTGHWILILILSHGLFFFLGAIVFCLTSVDTMEKIMIDKDLFLKDLKSILSNPKFYSYIYDDAKKIINEYCFLYFKSGDIKESVEKCNRITLDSLKSILENGFGSPQEPLCETSLELTKEQIEFEKIQVRHLDGIKTKCLIAELSKIPCERRIYNRGHYFNCVEKSIVCSFCVKHIWDIKRECEEKNETN